MKKFVYAIFTDRGRDLGLMFLRLSFGVMMITHGAAKLANFSTLKATFPDPIGWGGTMSLAAIICVEIGASLLIIAGLLTRLAAIALMFSMCIAAFVVHAPFSLSGSELPLLYLLVYVTLFIGGAGKYSADHLIARRLQRENA